MIDFALPIEIPKPAIIRPAPEDLLRYGSDPMAAMLPGIMPVIAGGPRDPEVLATNYGEANTTASSFTMSHTVAAGADCLLVCVGAEDSNAQGFSISGVTYNGVSLTALVQEVHNASGGRARAEVWMLANPPTGAAYNIVVSRSGSVSQFRGYAVTVFDAKNASQAGPTGSTTTLSSNRMTVSSVTSAASLRVGIAVSTYASVTATWSSGVVEVTDESFHPQPINSHVGYYEDAAASTYSFFCQLTGSTSRRAFAVAALTA